jgi:hypothetical protein
MASMRFDEIVYRDEFQERHHKRFRHRVGAVEAARSSPTP